MSHKNYFPFLTFLVGAVLALAISAFATTIGTDITTSGSLGVATSTPSFPLSVDGAVFFDSPEIRFASSSAPTLTLAYQAAATSTVRDLANAWSIATTTTASKPAISVDAANTRVGIGKIKPTQPLHVFKAQGPANIEMETSSGNAGLYLVAGNNGYSPFVPSTQDTINIWSDTASDEVFVLGTSGNLSLGSYAGSGTLAPSGGLIVSGNVGVGTSSPSSKFSVSSSATTTVHIGSTSSTQGSCVQMYSPNGTAYRLFVANDGTLTTEAGTCE